MALKGALPVASERRPRYHVEEQAIDKKEWLSELNGCKKGASVMLVRPEVGKWNSIGLTLLQVQILTRPSPRNLEASITSWSMWAVAFYTLMGRQR